MNNYYTYAYLREDRTPYYIGKGKGDRIYRKRDGEVRPPEDKTRIIFLKKNLTEEEAFRHEIYMIFVFGRKDLGVGILRNKTNGGDGVSGLIHSEEHRRKVSEANRKRIITEETRRKMREKIITEETKIKIKNSTTGEKNPFYGKTHSEETKRIISENRSNYWKITFSNGTSIVIRGLAKWAKENGYYNCKVSSGKLKNYKDIIEVEKLSYHKDT